MTKKKPQSRSGSAVAPNVNTEKILPGGGLALPQDAATETTSTSTTPTVATPPSGAESPGGYFARFEGFTPKVDAKFIDQFNRLAIQQKWDKDEKARRRNEAVEHEFESWFGNDTSNLAKWQELCEIVGLDTKELTSLTKCKKALGSRKVMVNLVNLVDHLTSGVPLIKFKNFHEFLRYTKKPGRRMNRQQAKQDGFIKVLLRRVF